MKTLKLLLFVIALITIPLQSFALPRYISPMGERVIIVDPREFAWGAYAPNGVLIRSGVASPGKDFCPDTGRPCRTKTGSFRIRSLGGPECVSPSFPIPTGGAPMPYCMYYTGAQALHGSYQVGHANLSHGCVRMHVGDAKWLRYNFARIGTLVIIKSY